MERNFDESVRGVVTRARKSSLCGLSPVYKCVCIFPDLPDDLTCRFVAFKPIEVGTNVYFFPDGIYTDSDYIGSVLLS